MKYYFILRVLASGTLNDAIIRMVTNHNEGKVQISLSDLAMRAKLYYAEWVSISPEFKTNESYPNKTLEIWEGTKHTFTITEQIMPDVPAPDVPKELTNDDKEEILKTLLEQ